MIDTSSKHFEYSKDKAREVAFPLGGIGTGCVSLAGNGRLVDWEIRNRPNKLTHNQYSFFAIKAEHDGKLMDARVLQGDMHSSRTGAEYRQDSSDYGIGLTRVSCEGMPHFACCTFLAQFPFSGLQLSHKAFPANVTLSAFNPMIPGNDVDSSIPAAFFEYEITNHAGQPVDYTICACINNFLSDARNKAFCMPGSPNINGILLETADKDAGQLCIATDAEVLSYQEYWYRGDWFDGAQTFWNDFTAPGKFHNRHYDTSGQNDSCTLAAHFSLAPGDTKKIRFLLSWYFPCCINYWNPDRSVQEGTPEFYEKNSWKNFYTKYFSGAADCAQYCLTQWDRLEKESLLFSRTLFASTLPMEVLDAVTANLCVLKSPTCLRNEDGSFYGFEGCNVTTGSCEGSCTHVWNYAYALPFLFPSLERSMRVNDYKINQNDSGAMCFRIPMPLGRRPDSYFPCADGQFGGVIKVYRDFKICGDLDWLIELWPSVRKALEFAWSPENPYGWDADCDGVLEGRQHHTLDMELVGPNSWLCSMYLAALKAGAELALIVRDKKRHALYTDLFEKGKAFVDKELFNGKYYYHKVDLSDHGLIDKYYSDCGSRYWNEETGEIKYQIGEGSSIDQVLGQWHAELTGLGEILDPDKVKSALKTIYDVNFKRVMRDFFNPCRIYACDDEAGTVICTYPDGARVPSVPVPYAQECMTGFEYQAASHMIFAGMVDEGLELVRAVRSRFDGEYRNPFNEFECGSNYARSMASYALLNALSGFTYDMYQHRIGFIPKMRFAEKGTFQCFFALDGGYGFVEQGVDYIQIKMAAGSIRIRYFETPKKPLKVYYGGRNWPFDADGNTAVMDNDLLCGPEKDIMVIL